MWGKNSAEVGLLFLRYRLPPWSPSPPNPSEHRLFFKAAGGEDKKRLDLEEKVVGQAHS